MKGWTLLGIALAIGGVVIFINGLNSRLGIDFNPEIGLNGNTPATKETLSQSDSAAIYSMVSLVAESESSMEDSSAVADSQLMSQVEEKELPHQIEPIIRQNKVATTNDAPIPAQAFPKTFSFKSDPDGRKQALVKFVRQARWEDEEIEQLENLLDDPRSNFRSEILVRNSTFEETADLYTHNVTPESISRSVKFYETHASELEMARKSYGVPQEILVSILKVETNLGEWRGKESVFNVFWSLSLGDDIEVQRALLNRDPDKASVMKGRMVKRAAWARGQLRDLLYVARHGGENPVGILGSFAGAFGLPQFIPSSYRSFGKDGNHDGVIDLDGIGDATASIGYYLKENGWPSRPERKRMRKSILNYNHSSFYAECVLSLADSLSMRLNGVPIADK